MSELRIGRFLGLTPTGWNMMGFAVVTVLALVAGILGIILVAGGSL